MKPRFWADPFDAFPGAGSIAIGDTMEIGGLVVTHAALSEDPYVPTSLTITFDATSAVRLAVFTAAHVGARVQVLVGEEVILAPRISSPIVGGVVVASMGQGREAVRLTSLLQRPDVRVSMRIAH